MTIQVYSAAKIVSSASVPKRKERRPAAYDTPEQRRAFNEGCDARIRGWGQFYNPYNSPNLLGNQVLSRAWLRGWQHVDKEWGRDCKQPERIRRLPDVVFG